MRRSFRLICLATMLLTACSTVPDNSEWFDAIHRTPVKRLVVNGHCIAYTDQGGGPPIIFVHGFGGSMWQWEYQQSLSSSFRTIILDVVGAGLSDKPDIDYTPEQFVGFLRDFMDALQIPHASLVGNSMGAGIVIGMSLTYPDRVEKLVLIDGLPEHVREKVISPSLQRALGPWPPIWIVKVGSWFAGRGTTKKVLSEMVYDDRLLTPAVIDRSDRNRQRPGLLTVLHNTVQHLPLWENGFAQRLGDIHVPTLILWGEKDGVFPLAIGLELHKKIKASQFESVPDAGHIPMWERPEIINPRLLDFLQP